MHIEKPKHGKLSSLSHVNPHTPLHLHGRHEVHSGMERTRAVHPRAEVWGDRAFAGDKKHPHAKPA